MKKKMQAVRFRSVREMLLFLPEDQRLIVDRLREVVYTYIPGVEERLSFNVPFFRKYKAICFIWPGAIPWGSKTRDGVEFGFNYGNLLADEAGYLNQGKRKQVFSKQYFDPEEIDEDILAAYIAEAVELDELMFLEKKNRLKK